MSELVWVAVPDGFRADDAQRAALRLLISPRLTTTSLAEAGMEHWPPLDLLSARLVVEFADAAAPGTLLASVEVEPPHIRAQPGVWEAFFGAGTTIIPPRSRGDSNMPPVEVAKTSELAGSINQTFVTVARARIEPNAHRQPLLEDAVRGELAARWSGEPPQVRDASRGARTAAVPPDFHRTMAMLREHPAVLRALGLIAEIEIPTVSIPVAATDPMLRLRCLGDVPALPVIVSPWTRYGDEFRPASTTNISNGMVTLTDDRAGTGEARWDVVTVDVENGAERLRQAARKVASGDGGIVPNSAAMSLPALRSAGMMLVRKGREEDFAQRRRNANANAGRGSFGETVLSADDLTIGYRIDVRDIEGKNWLSLHEREARYRIGEGPAEIVLNGGFELEEGHVKANAAIDDGSGTLRADEVVARWDGWSLAIQRPPFDAAPGRAAPSRRVNNMPFQFAWDYNPVPGRLPRLRFAHSYRLRARVADMAGGGLKVEDPAAERCFTEAVAYRRFEPILSPELAMPGRAPADGQLGPAERVQHMVLRSDRGTDAQTFAAKHPRYAVNLVRELHPPRTSLALAEQHGALDELDTGEAWDRVRRAIAKGEAGTTEPALPDFAAAGICVFPRPEPGGVAASITDRPWTGDWPNLIPKRVELRERIGGHVDSVVWQDGHDGGQQLVVRLAPAEQVTLDISSFPIGDMVDHFAIQPVPHASLDAVNQGRHPLVSPASAVTFVHAVRRPLSDPAGRLVPESEPGQTFAILAPDPLLLGADTASTSQLDVTASWTEFSDDATVAQVNVPVQSLFVSRGDAAFNVQLRHEFGDTKHRVIAYEATAVSRFRQYYDAEESADAFLARGSLRENPISIPSTARPAPPVVVSTRPAFLWEEAREAGVGFSRITRRRLGGRLRVELERPWFQSGEGEKLAVVVWFDGKPPEAMHPFLTRAGLDPIWDVEAPVQWPTASSFADTAVAIGSPRLAEAEHHVVAVPFAPFFHDGYWYADVTLPSLAASSYCPFVQLAVARYQPDSLVREDLDLRLSQVVRTEMVQLLPDRELTVTQVGDSLEVAVKGFAPQVPHHNRVDVILERASAAALVPEAITLTAFEPPPDGTPAWVPLIDRIAHLEPGGEVTVQVPPTAGPFRLRVREVELIGPDDGSFPPQSGTSAELTERIVFADVLPLPLS